jgi:hypothetical protein
VGVSYLYKEVRQEICSIVISLLPVNVAIPLYIGPFIYYINHLDFNLVDRRI